MKKIFVGLFFLLCTIGILVYACNMDITTSAVVTQKYESPTRSGVTFVMEAVKPDGTVEVQSFRSKTYFDSYQMGHSYLIDDTVKLQSRKRVLMLAVITALGTIVFLAFGVGALNENNTPYIEGVFMPTHGRYRGSKWRP